MKKPALTLSDEHEVHDGPNRSLQDVEALAEVGGAVPSPHALAAAVLGPEWAVVDQEGDGRSAEAQVVDLGRCQSLRRVGL